MPTKEQSYCPLFEDVICPQGDDAAEACKVRLEGDYDPVADGRDYLFMNCAIRRAKEQEKGINDSEFGEQRAKTE